MGSWCLGSFLPLLSLNTLFFWGLYLGLPWSLPWSTLVSTLVYLGLYLGLPYPLPYFFRGLPYPLPCFYLVSTLFFRGLPYPLPCFYLVSTLFFRWLPYFGASHSLYSLLSMVFAIASRRLSQLAVSSSLYLSRISVAFPRIRLRLARSVVACACSSKVARYLVSQPAP